MAVPDAMHNCQHRAIDLLYKEFVRIAPCTASLLINIIDAISDSGQNSPRRWLEPEIPGAPAPQQGGHKYPPRPSQPLSPTIKHHYLCIAIS